MNNFKKLRLAQKLTQREVAQCAQVDASTVTKWETGGSKPRADTLLKLASLFNCTVDMLLRGDDEKPSQHN